MANSTPSVFEKESPNRLVHGYHPGKTEMLNTIFYGFWYPGKFYALLRSMILPNLLPRFFRRKDLLRVGSAAPNGQLQELKSRKNVELSDILQMEKRPVVLIFGSYT